MKKLLTATLAIAMGATIVGTVAGCNKPNTQTDEEKAEKAIGIIRALYYDDKEETAASYTVVGKVQVEGSVYDVDWTVTPAATCTVENFSNYVSLGELNTDTDEYTVSISKAEVKIEYTLKASVTVNEATKSIEFKHSVPAGKDITDLHTQQATIVFNDKENRTTFNSEQQIWQQNGIKFINDKYNSSSAVADYADPVRCYKGSKVSIEYPGIIQINFTSREAVGDSNYPTDLKTCLEDANWPGAAVSINGDVVTVDLETPVECFEFVASAAQCQIKQVNVVGVVGGATDEQKVDVAKAMLALDADEYTAVGTYDLPATKNGAAVTWNVKGTSEYVSIASGKLVVGKMPASETSVVLVATITSGTENATKEFTVKLTKIEGVTHAGTLADPYLPSEANIVAKRLGENEYSSTVYVKGYVIEPGTYAGSNFNNFDNMYIADSATSTKGSDDALYVFRPTADGTYLTTAGFNKGDLVTFVGKLQNYKGNTMELTGGKCVARTEVVDERTDAQKAQAALDALTIPSTVTGNITLTSSVTGVTLSITSSTNTGAIALNGTVTRGEADVQVTITVTATIGDAHPTKDYTVTVKATAATFEAGTYKLALQQVTLGKKLYFTGALDGYYGGTTESVAQAADIIVAVADGGYTLKVSSTNKYIELVVSGNYVNFALQDASSGVWEFNGDLGVFTWTNTKGTYYLGTRENYTTISASLISYISGNNAGNVGVTQFVAEFEKVTEISDAEKVEAAKEVVDLRDKYNAGSIVTLPNAEGDVALSWAIKEGTGATLSDYTLTCSEITSGDEAEVTLTVTLTLGTETQTKDIKITVVKVAVAETGTFKMYVINLGLSEDKLYFTGTINSSNFGVTTKDVADAADVVVENAPGGYYLKVNGKYLELNSSHRMTLVDNSNGVWDYDATNSVFTWYVTAEDEVYYLGTYGTFDTISASKTSYLTGSTNYKVVLAVETDTRADQEIVDAAKGSLELEKTNYTATGTYNLPTTKSGASLSWAVKGETNLLEIADGNRLVINNLPDSATEITLVVTITSGTVSDNTTEIKITVAKGVNYGTLAAPLSVTEALKLYDEECRAQDDVTKQVVYMTGRVVNTVAISGQYYQNIRIADLNNSTKDILVYRLYLRDGVTATPIENDVVIICGYMTNYLGTTPEFAYKNNTNVYLESHTVGTSKVELGSHEGATVTGLPETETAQNGTGVSFTVTVVDGKELVSVKLNGTALVADNGTYNFTVAGNATVTVETKEAGSESAKVFATLGFTAAERGDGTTSDKKISTYSSSFNSIRGDITWKIDNFNNNSWNNDWTYIKAGSKNGASTGIISTTTAVAGTVSQVIVTIDKVTTANVKSFKLYVYSDAELTAKVTEVSLTIAQGINTFEIPKEYQNTGLYYQIAVECSQGSNGMVQLSKVELYGYAA